MNIYEIIEKKKHNDKLTKEEIDFFVDRYTKNEIPDYQISALLMAIYFNGLDIDETYYLTKSIIDSGEEINLSKIDGIKVDKHSTGGVGDTTSLVLGPLLASTGVVFAKMSGRGLGHTGGTLDKLESIPGFNINLSIDEFIKNTNKTKISIIGQSEDITPADKKLYALRDATATVDNISLIAASIISKKIALDTDALVLDVKMGSGAFMKDLKSAEELAKTLVDLGRKFGRKTAAIITNMDEPLGFAVGNSLEVIEAIDTLKGEGPKDLEELCVDIAAKLLIMTDIYTNVEEAKKVLYENIKNGKAFEKFKEFVDSQGGDVSYIENINKFKLSKYKKDIKIEKEGYINYIDALKIGEIARILGAGRLKKEDEIDLGAGIVLTKKINDYVNKSDIIATIYTNKKELLDDIDEKIIDTFKLSDKEISYKLILEEID